jgi:hypothetical protein
MKEHQNNYPVKAFFPKVSENKLPTKGSPKGGCHAVNLQAILIFTCTLLGRAHPLS